MPSSLTGHNILFCVKGQTGLKIRLTPEHHSKSQFYFHHIQIQNAHLKPGCEEANVSLYKTQCLSRATVTANLHVIYGIIKKSYMELKMFLMLPSHESLISC